MSESGDERRGPRQGRRRNQNSQSDEKELATQLVTIQSKRFYIDVKENQRGRFIKLVELAQGGRRNRVLMSMNVANEFKQKLQEFSDLNASLGPAAQTPAANENKDQQNKKSRDNQNEGLIKSETLVKDNKRYYFDLRENQRGRFLRVSQVIQRGPRNVIAIPAQGLVEFKDHLTDLIERYGTGFMEESQNQAQLPESKSLRVNKKMFYFDCGSNVRGSFLKVSEVNNRYRSSITIPDNFITQFRDLLNEYVDKIAVAAPPAATQSDETQSESK